MTILINSKCAFTLKKIVFNDVLIANQSLTELHKICIRYYSVILIGFLPMIGLAQSEFRELKEDEQILSTIDSLYDQGLLYHRKSLNDSAIIVFDMAIKLAEYSDQKPLQAKLYLAQGRAMLTDFGPRDKPSQLLMQGLELFTQIKDTAGMANSYLQLGVLNFDMENYESSISYFNQIIQILNKEEDVYAITEYLLALSYSEIHDFERADSMFIEASKRYGEMNPSNHLLIKSFQGKMLINQGRPEAALDHFNKIEIPYYDSAVGPTELIVLHSYFSTAYLQVENYEQAIRYGRKCYNAALFNGATMIYLREAQTNLQKAYLALEKYDSAYFFLNELNIISDSVSNNRISQRIAELEGQFAFDQKNIQLKAEQALKDERTKASLDKEKLRRNILLGAIVLALLVAKLLFNQRNRIKREKSRSDDLLLNILPEKIAQELKNKGKAEAQHFHSVPILFSDFKSFTIKSMELTARELVAEIDTCFVAFDAIIEKHGIEKIKTIGDAYMAAGGIPEPKADAVQRTILAGIDMQRFIQNRISEKIAANEDYFEMRIGIHIGPVIAGIVGSKKFQYDIWGDTVNTASRMESCGEVGKVNISHDTYLKIRDDDQFEFENRGFVEAKGKGEIHMWFVSIANR